MRATVSMERLKFQLFECILASQDKFGRSLTDCLSFVCVFVLLGNLGNQ